MLTPSGRRPEVDAVELDPRVCLLSDRLWQQPDHDLGGVPLLAQQAKEDEGARQAARSRPANTQAPVDGAP